jgi:hypothetical protein
LFVLDPLAEIAGAWIDPVTGKSVKALRDQASGSRPQASSDHLTCLEKARVWKC